MNAALTAMTTVIGQIGDLIDSATTTIDKVQLSSLYSDLTAAMGQLLAQEQAELSSEVQDDAAADQMLNEDFPATSSTTSTSSTS